MLFDSIKNWKHSNSDLLPFVYFFASAVIPPGKPKKRLENTDGARSKSEKHMLWVSTAREMEGVLKDWFLLRVVWEANSYEQFICRDCFVNVCDFTMGTVTWRVDTVLFRLFDIV